MSHKQTEFSLRSKIALEQSRIRNNENLIDLIVEQLQTATSAVVTIFTEYDPTKNLLIPKKILVEQKLLEMILRISGKKILKTETTVSSDVLNNLETQVVFTWPSINAATGGAIPEALSVVIHKILDIDQLYSIIHIIDGQIYGTSTIGLKANQPKPPMDFLEFFSFVTAISLRRNKAEESLRKLNEDLENIIKKRTAELTIVNDKLLKEIEERKKMQEEIKQLAFFDPLTGLPNRRLFYDRLQQAIIEAERNKTNLAIFFLDLDIFKSVNDTMGHAHGDELLKEVSKRLVKLLRKSDIVSRFGGDEFVILIINPKNEQSIRNIAENILNNIRNPFKLNNTDQNITTSLGISIYSPDRARDADTLLKNADAAMYKAKEKGKNTYEIYK